MTKRIVSFSSNYELLFENWYGFREGTGANATQTLVKIIYVALDVSRPIIVVFLDLKKAFDIVDQP